MLRRHPFLVAAGLLAAVWLALVAVPWVVDHPSEAADTAGRVLDAILPPYRSEPKELDPAYLAKIRAERAEMERRLVPRDTSTLDPLDDPWAETRWLESELEREEDLLNSDCVFLAGC